MLIEEEEAKVEICLCRWTVAAQTKTAPEGAAFIGKT
jgi:hypothetical protein